MACSDSGRIVQFVRNNPPIRKHLDLHYCLILGHSFVANWEDQFAEVDTDESLAQICRLSNNYRLITLGLRGLTYGRFFGSFKAQIVQTMERYQPEVVLLDLGVNDLDVNRSVDHPFVDRIARDVAAFLIQNQAIRVEFMSVLRVDSARYSPYFTDADQLNTNVNIWNSRLKSYAKDNPYEYGFFPRSENTF